MKKNILAASFVFISFAIKAQSIDSIYINLYTDSLKKGTYNYINIDGKLSNGRYLPLDSTFIIFTASAGKFYGNSLWIDKNFAADKVHIMATLRKNPAVNKSFDIWVKTMEPYERLRTTEEILNGTNKSSKQKRN